MGITKIFITICMNVCKMSQKEACHVQHLFDSIPQGNWVEESPPQVGGKYSIIYAPAFIIDLMPKICIKVYTT